MTDRTSATEVEQAGDRELSPEELDEVTGGTGSARRNAYNAAQQPWQATIDPEPQQPPTPWST